MAPTRPSAVMTSNQATRVNLNVMTMTAAPSHSVHAPPWGAKPNTVILSLTCNTVPGLGGLTRHQQQATPCTVEDENPEVIQRLPTSAVLVRPVHVPALAGST